MNLDPNLFISYAHIDNQPLSPGEEGWITRFHDILENVLSTRLGEKANIWRDKKLTGNDVFGDEIVTQFSKATVMVSIVTSRYLKSDWCMREVSEFCKGALSRGGLKVNNKSRVFKVMKTPVEPRALLPDVLGYEFFEFKDGAPLELDPAFGREFGEKYMQKVALLAWNIAEMLMPHEGPQNPPIYLAECSRDRKPERDLLHAELTRLGYPVLPDMPMPYDDELVYVPAVEGMLARCALSIHLIGSTYGTVPDGPTGKSVVMLQNELAVARCRNAKLERLIWLPKGTSSDQPNQQTFIDALLRDGEAQFGADLLMGDVEEFKAAIHTTLKKIEQPPAAAVREHARADVGGEPKLLYLICTEKDWDNVQPLRTLCEQHGFDVVRPAFIGTSAEIRSANEDALANCDAAILYYGAGDEGWRNSKEVDLKRATGFRRDPLTRAVYLAEPKTRDKELIAARKRGWLIDGFAGLPGDAVVEFLKKASTGGQS